MEETTRDAIKRMALDAEKKAVGSFLRWRYRRREMDVPPEGVLEDQSREVAGRLNEAAVKAGAGIWKEIKKACRGGPGKGDEEHNEKQ
ncbi:MAG: hypothetical protein C4582_13225 [Desulfobacteraceae bacterium]|jgi:cytochrome c|nr:MAG: hypothetical protein C4582_13225 [Desulfobacteraceae bacterium]